MDNITKELTWILNCIEGTNRLRKELRETPARVQRAYEEMFNGYDTDIPALFKTFEEDGTDQIIVMRNIEYTSVCEHHLLPFSGHASIAYLPSEKVIGASKLGRLVHAYSNRLQIQERLGRQIADTMMEYLSPLGVMVVLRGTHQCMRCRGLKSQDSEMVTSVIRGVFRDKNSTSRMEALMLIGDRL